MLDIATVSVIPIVSPRYPPTIKPTPTNPNIIIKKEITLPINFSLENVCKVEKIDAIQIVIKMLLKKRRKPATIGSFTTKNRNKVKENTTMHPVIIVPFANFAPYAIKTNEPNMAPTKFALVTNEYPVPVNPRTSLQ